MTTAESDREWKAKAARIQRHRVKQRLQTVLDADSFAGKRWDAVNPWSSPKYGKHWFVSTDPRWMRK